MDLNEANAPAPRPSDLSFGLTKLWGFASHNG
jgi:hypothetical protein